MPIFHLIILAIVQGITEFLPVSSSAHLILAPVVLGWEDQGRAIDVAAHIGSLGAVILYFWADVRRLFFGGLDTLQFKDTENRHLFLTIAIATVPLVLFGAVLALTGLADLMRDPQVIAASSIVFGIVLWIADRRPEIVDEDPKTWRAIMTIGAAQALAVIPGTSRSGITVTAARWLGFTRESAARFSMLLAIPAILASGAYEAVALMQDGGEVPLMPIALVAVFSFAAAYLAIVIFLRLASRMNFTPFVIYRIALGVLLFAIFS